MVSYMVNAGEYGMPAPIDLSGTMLSGRYLLQHQLGRGGMAVVYAAEDLRFSRRVAIKVAIDQSSEIGAERLFREAKANARIHHPAVVTVFSDGNDTDSSIDYIVMERLEGETLATRILRDGQLPIALVQNIGVVLADVLAVAHSSGVIHRDVKPANVFLAHGYYQQDEIKLMDFGIAKHADLHTITTPDELLGTLPYLAPELLQDPKRTDARTDLYALGVTLFEALAGRLPFTAQNPRALTPQILHEPLPKLLALRADTPSMLAQVVERCMLRDPETRYARASDVLAALRACTG
jgi:serine/threonine protein kinase